MVPHDIGQAKNAPFFPDPCKKLFDALLLGLDCHLLSILEELVIERHLVVYRVRASTLATLLQRREMNHIVSTISRDVEVLVPLVYGTHPFRNDRLNDKAVCRQGDVLASYFASSLLDIKRLKRFGENTGPLGNRQDGVDVECAHFALNTLALGGDFGCAIEGELGIFVDICASVVLNKVVKHSGLRDGKVNPDGLAEIIRQAVSVGA